MGFSLVWVYAGCMLITGSVNTISTKYQDLTVERVQADGTLVYFQHPAFQSAMMFSGEALCLIPYFILRWRKRAIKAQQGILNTKPPMPRTFVLKRVAAFAIPTLCDATATTLLNIGLFYTFASTFQMLRGTLVLFAGCLTILILRRRLYLHHWLGMVLIAAGAAIVGFASVVQSNRHYPPHHHHRLPPAAMSPTGESMLGGGMQRQGSYDLGSMGVGSMGGGETGGLLLPGAGAHDTGRSLLESHWLVQGLHTLRKGGSSSSSSSSSSSWGSDQAGLNGEGFGGGWFQAGAPVLPIVGDTLVVLAQLFAAMQFILEEKFLAKYRMQPLLAVGVEGAWGVVLSLCALPVLGFMQAPNGLPLEDASAAFGAMARMPDLRNAVILSVVSIGAFNWFGLSVTQALSGASRATIDACRTMLVWFFSLAAGWETFHELQVLGFVVLISGTSLYNELIRSCLPPPSAPEGTDEDDVEQGESSDAVRGAYTALAPGPSGTEEASRTAGPARPPRGRAQGGRQSSRSQDIRSTTGRTAPHHHHHRNILARSVRLGYNVLSPHSLGDDPDADSSEGDDEGEGGHMQHEDGGRRKGVMYPMDLASTPFPDGSFLLQHQLDRSRSGRFSTRAAGRAHNPAPVGSEVREDPMQEQEELEGMNEGEPVGEEDLGNESTSESGSENGSGSSSSVGAEGDAAQGLRR